MLRRDLESAEISYKDETGKVADFHSLRHTYITNIVKTGASAKVAQNLARHSDIKLTMDTYTHLTLHDGKAALSGLPKLPDVDRTSGESSRAVAYEPELTTYRLLIALQKTYKKLLL